LAARWSHPALLISVRSAAEAEAAIAGGAAIVDVKEPVRGPLGRAGLAVETAVAAIASGAGVPATSAGGELLEPGLPPAAPGPSHYKVGLAHCAALQDWPRRLDRLARALAGAAAPARLIAVAYADHLLARAPPPGEVVAYAVSMGLDAVLIDTFAKSAGSIRDLLPEREIAAFVARARDGGVRAAVAGSLAVEDIRPLLALGAEVIAIRGAACAGGRNGVVDAARVARLGSEIRAASPPCRR
jgi:uncharacterized protein (UPF0264 family)